METQIPKKEKRKKFFNKILKFIKPLLRGAGKSLPLVGGVIELGLNIRDEFKKAQKNHSYISISLQLICGGVIVYAFATKQITIDDVITFMHKIVETFGE